MQSAHASDDLFGSGTTGAVKVRGAAVPKLRLDALIDADADRVEITWFEADGGTVIARGTVACDREFTFFYAVQWKLRIGEKAINGHSTFDGASVHAKLKAWRKLLPVDDADVTLRIKTLKDTQPLDASPERWKHLGTCIHRCLQPQREVMETKRRKMLAGFVAAPPAPAIPSTEWSFQFECHSNDGIVAFAWMKRGDRQPVWVVSASLSARERLTWTIRATGTAEITGTQANLIESRVKAFFKERPFAPQDAVALWVTHGNGSNKQKIEEEPPFETIDELTSFIVREVRTMIEATRDALPFEDPIFEVMPPEQRAEYDRLEAIAIERMQKERRKAEADLTRKREAMARLAAEKIEKEKQRDLARREAALAKEAALAAKAAQPAKAKQEPLPPLPVHLDLAPLTLTQSATPLADLRKFFLIERAAMWWVSNQSDDLLCLPHCRIQRLDYQVRTALRVLGPLRGRALLSDEVGLGKTIEAGLVLKELLTRGLARRVLVLTVPSLVDQWEEELADKFSLTVATTNHATTRAEGISFWSAHPLIVASLHTLKQPANLAAARQVAWDCLIVDEAHHLRNRDSQAWQAVNALPRQFLLLLTATPVQNSLEELYNLVTLLQPGQLPTPREFRARHMDPKKPRQPREPEELRRLLGQVMIRNTRASSGIELPPRHAETVLFDPDDDEREFWIAWEQELRTALDALPANQSSLWGRLLLQAAGSSPAAWHAMLEKFPNAKLVKEWRKRAPLKASWQRKCALLPPLAHGEGGCVIFTQFLDTQAALGKELTAAGVAVFSINGSTPAAERQPVVEKFKREGGALLLTQSGTEGRNLQFCHRLINFDLPWNPMEIEQRIGRLHRMGQKHPVRIFNLVQNGTLQEHLLTILQEKLNLFELVVGETGLVLGEKFSSDEFAEEILRRWRSAGDDVAASFADLGDELAAARSAYGEVKALDETLFAQDYQTD